MQVPALYKLSAGTFTHSCSWKVEAGEPEESEVILYYVASLQQPELHGTDSKQNTKAVIEKPLVLERALTAPAED